MRIKKFNESIRDQMKGKELDEIKLKTYDFIQEMEDKIEDGEELNGEDLTKIFDFIKNVKGASDRELINILIDTQYITPSRILFLIQSSLYNSNKQDAWHYYEPKVEEVDDEDILVLLNVLKTNMK